MRQKRIPAYLLESDQEILRDLTGASATNRKQIETAKKALAEVITQDLTPRQREMINFYYYQNLNHRQIAEQLGIDSSTVCRTLQRARNRIYKALHIYFDYLYFRLEEDS
ncbi:MAG: sigma-70 family RNA polymerase sigma factor [Oscillospiraceae bacterium]|nr:sigma-70 family RNA polymerase sigma factor [Oscillospiraceae bacterium]